MDSIPIIDLESISSTSIANIDKACRDHGFFFVVGHNIDSELNALRETAKRFFDTQKTHKRKFMRTAENPFGYYDREQTKQKRDLKEVFDFYVPSSQSGPPMTWPTEPVEFKDVLSSYFASCTDVAQRILELIALSLECDQGVFTDMFNNAGTSSARLNFYPSEDPLDEDEQNAANPLGDMALHHHTDQGAITLLHQDDVDGLQAYSEVDGWLDVPPMPNALVINIGDLVQVWSNDQYKAALHRVRSIPAGRSRFSFPYFYQPAMSAKVAPLEPLGTPKFREFGWQEFIEERVSGNYADTNENDIQISKYRI